MSKHLHSSFDGAHFHSSDQGMIFFRGYNKTKWKKKTEEYPTPKTNSIFFPHVANHMAILDICSHSLSRTAMNQKKRQSKSWNGTYLIVYCHSYEPPGPHLVCCSLSWSWILRFRCWLFYFNQTSLGHQSIYTSLSFLPLFIAFCFVTSPVPAVSVPYVTVYEML